MLIDRILLSIIRFRLRHRADFYSAVGRAVLDHVARVRAAESEARDREAYEATKLLARRIECQRFVTDTVGLTTSLPIQ